jgi:hypothetical protein
MITFGVGASTLVGSQRNTCPVGKMRVRDPSATLSTAIVSRAFRTLSSGPVEVTD